MKNLIVITFVTFLTFFSCTKDKTNNETILEISNVPINLISKIKSWHESAMNNKNRYLSPEAKNDSKRDLLIPDYNKATYTTLPNGATVTAVGIEDIKFTNSNIAFFRTFVFLGAYDGIVDGKIVEFYGDPNYINKNRQYLIDNYNKKSLEGFTGSIFTYDVYYRPLRSRTYKDGKFVSADAGIIKKPSKGSITSQVAKGSIFCEDQTSRMTQCYDVWWVTASSSEYLYSYCCEETGGGSPGGGGSSEPPVPINSFTGFPANPIDGQTAIFTDPYGSIVEFTYSSSLNVWLMPELQALKEIGNTLTIPNMPTFDPGSILTSVALPALIEPSFFGEIILSGAALYVSSVYVYSLIVWISERERLEDNVYCNMYYVPCVGSGSQLPCDDCLHYCIVQGVWDAARCPSITPEIN